MIVKVKGKSSKGKNRVNEHGDQWEVIRTDKALCCGDEISHFAASVNTGYTRWFALENDRDFEILSTDG